MQVLDPIQLLEAYCSGAFPMDSDYMGIRWYSPDPRGILPVQDFHVPRSVRAEIRKNAFEIRVDTQFELVMRSCAKRFETWISEEIIRCYSRLHQLGYAHSVEAWHEGELVGGLYGVAIGGAYFGESMFSARPGGSKAALVWLGEHLKRKKFVLHDTQWTTLHLALFGGEEIPREDYLDLLEEAITTEVSFLG